MSVHDEGKKRSVPCPANEITEPENEGIKLLNIKGFFELSYKYDT